jgi:hypothetical protein
MIMEKSSDQVYAVLTAAFLLLLVLMYFIPDVKASVLDFIKQILLAIGI